MQRASCKLQSKVCEVESFESFVLFVFVVSENSISPILHFVDFRSGECDPLPPGPGQRWDQLTVCGRHFARQTSPLPACLTCM